MIFTLWHQLTNEWKNLVWKNQPTQPFGQLFIIRYLSIISCNLFYIPVKLISRQGHPWSFISATFANFSALYTWSVDQPVPMVDHPHYVLVYDLTILYIEGCRFINKQSTIVSFLDWEGHIWIFFQTPNMSHSLSSDHSLRHTNGLSAF